MFSKTIVWSPNSEFRLRFFKEEGELDDDQETEGRYKGVGYVVRIDALQDDLDFDPRPVVGLVKRKLFDCKLS